MAFTSLIIPVIDAIRESISSLSTWRRESKERDYTKCHEFLEEITKIIDAYIATAGLLYDLDRKSQSYFVDEYEYWSPFEHMDELRKINRDLLRIASDMRIVVKSIKKRFYYLNTKKIKLITDKTLQIVLTEDMMNIVFANTNNSDLFPIDPNRLNKGLGAATQSDREMTERLSKIMRKDGCAQLRYGSYDTIIGELQILKEAVAIALYD